MFNACRIPARPIDDTLCYEPDRNNHVVVVRKNHFFTFDLVHAAGSALSTAEIECQLQKIIDMAGNISDPCPVGALTTEHRDTWFKARGELLKLGNESALNRIESAVFLLCLDDTSPVTREEVRQVHA